MTPIGAAPAPVGASFTRFQWLILAAVFLVLWETTHLLTARHVLDAATSNTLTGPLLAAIFACLGGAGIGPQLAAVLHAQTTVSRQVEQVAALTDANTGPTPAELAETMKAAALNALREHQAELAAAQVTTTPAPAPVAAPVPAPAPVAAVVPVVVYAPGG